MSVDLDQYEAEVREYFGLPWTVEVRRYDDGTHFARVVELPGCMTEADSRLEVLDQLDDALAEWLAVALEDGQQIPTPQSDESYSGKIFVRTSPALHARVADCAAKMNVSMSQWIGEILAREVGRREADSSYSRVAEEISQMRSLLNRTLAKPRYEQSVSPVTGSLEDLLQQYLFVRKDRAEPVTRTPIRPPIPMHDWKSRRQIVDESTKEKVG